jgi:hypothetical protein
MHLPCCFAAASSRSLITQQSMITVFSLAQAEIPMAAGITNNMWRNAGFMIFDTLLGNRIVISVSTEEAH